MTCNNIRAPANIHSNLLMGNRIFIPIHNKRTNRTIACKFINRYRITRHLLHSGTLSLLYIARSSLHLQSRIHSMILSIPWTYHKPTIKGQFAAIFTEVNIIFFPQNILVLAAFCLKNTTVQYVLRKDFALECVFTVYEHNSLNEAVLCSL
jgi:hypothetical protein